jgi:hypothetical protein
MAIPRTAIRKTAVKPITIQLIRKSNVRYQIKVMVDTLTSTTPPLRAVRLPNPYRTGCDWLTTPDRNGVRKPGDPLLESTEGVTLNHRKVCGTLRDLSPADYVRTPAFRAGRQFAERGILDGGPLGFLGLLELATQAFSDGFGGHGTRYARLGLKIFSESDSRLNHQFQ